MKNPLVFLEKDFRRKSGIPAQRIEVVE